MLSKLFGSNSRVQILKAFLFHPEEKFYIRQLARDLSLQVNSIRRELDNLENFGLLAAQTGDEDGPEGEKGKGVASQERKYYRLNKDFPLYEDVKSLFVKSQLLYKDDLVRDLGRAGNIKLLILSGVFVNNFQSPVDVLIVGKVVKDKVVKTINDLEKELGREINYTLMTVAEFKYRREITDVFIYEILEGEKIVVIDEMELN